MGLSFNYKVNSHEFLYNKEKNIPTLKIDGKRIADKYTDIGVLVLRPIIDKLDFGFSPTKQFLVKYDPTQDVEEYKKYIKGSLYQDAVTNSGETGLTQVQNVNFLKPPYSNYNVNLHYRPANSSDYIFIQVGPKNEQSNLDFIKFSMNPSRFSKAALAEFRAFIEDTFNTATASVPYEEFVIWAEIYRADIAVDILGARPYELVVQFLEGKEPAAYKTSTVNSESGRMETTYLKAKPGKTSKEKLYDKRKEQIDNGKTPIYGDCLHSRFEAQVGKTTFYKLAKVHNRCSRISVQSVDYKKFKKMRHAQRLFIYHAIDRNLDKALELIPAKLKASYKKSYVSVMHNIWDAEKIWSFWKDTIAESGLFPSKDS